MRPLDVHFALMQRLPVRTIPAKPLPPDEPYRSSPEQTLALHARIRELKAAGKRNYEIADDLRVSRATVSYHTKGHCSTAAKAAKRR